MVQHRVQDIDYNNGKQTVLCECGWTGDVKYHREHRETDTENESPTNPVQQNVIHHLGQFKKRENRQRPELCYGFEKKDGLKKWMIFTMDAGKTFLATIEQKRSDGRYYEEFNETHNSIDKCLIAFKAHNAVISRADFCIG